MGIARQAGAYLSIRAFLVEYTAGQYKLRVEPVVYKVRSTYKRTGVLAVLPEDSVYVHMVWPHEIKPGVEQHMFNIPASMMYVPSRAKKYARVYLGGDGNGVYWVRLNDSSYRSMFTMEPSADNPSSYRTVASIGLYDMVNNYVGSYSRGA